MRPTTYKDLDMGTAISVLSVTEHVPIRLLATEAF